MSLVVQAVPAPPPPPVVDPWRGVGQRFEPPVGPAWVLSGDGAGGVRMLPGVRGLLEPPREVFVDEPAGVAGGRWRGARDLVREVYWPIGVYQDTDSQAWLEYDAAWRRALSTARDVPGRWVVTHPGGTERHLPVQFVTTGDPAWEFAPGMIEWATYGTKMLAVDPYWRSATISAAWSGAPDPSETFAGSGGPPFTISEGGSIASAQMTNPGELPAYPVWWVQDVTSVDLSVGNGVIKVPAVDADRLLVVDADPRELYAIEVDAPPTISPVTGEPMTDVEREAWVAQRLPDGLDRTIELGETTWGAIPAGGTTQVGIEMAGTGTVRCSIVPRYWSAW